MSAPGNLDRHDELQVRSAAPEDAAAIAAVHVASFLATYPHLPTTRRAAEGGLPRWTEVWAGRLAETAIGRSTLVATEAGRVCGFVHLGPSPDPDDDPGVTGQVLSIHVDPPSTGRGIGARLMVEAVAALRAAGHRAATLWVVAENSPARAFYRRLGWREDGATRREVLAVDGEEGDRVTVVRYRVDLGPDPEEGS